MGPSGNSSYILPLSHAGPLFCETWYRSYNKKFHRTDKCIMLICFYNEFYLKFNVQSSTVGCLERQPFPKQALVITCLQYKSFKKSVGKGEIAHNKQFLLFPQCFLVFMKNFHHFHQIQNDRLQILSILTNLEILSFGKGLRS